MSDGSPLWQPLDLHFRGSLADEVRYGSETLRSVKI
jgi:hypothetical protein